MANALVSIQIIPKLKDGGDTYPLVDEAIRIIAESGVKYEVHPLETTMEGDLSLLMQVIEKMNQKMIEQGSISVISQVKIVYRPEGITMNSLTKKYR
ncbi:thiamine-binding protein [Bacillus niameyensis]|uniref:thiamine-binding protein n=1 Tax=Bacillus niameyensis TaxID=1522308 RepID=UPI00078442F0|nr:thiamine-binding protein [Bacillus niameyensis]